MKLFVRASESVPESIHGGTRRYDYFEKGNRHMTIEQVKDEFGASADDMCQRLCTYCIANDWYCPSYCASMEWVQKHYDKAVERMAKLDGDYYEFFKRVRTWK